MRLAVDLTRFDRGTAPIWLEAGAQAFPEHAWSDFVVRVVHEFVVSTRALLYAEPGERAKALFYDGPYAVILEKASSTGLRVVTPDWSAETSFAAWQSDLHGTARAVLTTCAAGAWTSPDVDTLAAHVPRA